MTATEMFNSRNGTAVVTSASTGIGAVYADQPARRGYDLILITAANLKGDLPLNRRIIHTTGRNRRPGFNLAVDLDMSLCSAIILMTFWTGIAAYAGTIQQQADAPPVPNVSRQEPLEDRVSSAPESVLKRFSNELNVNVSSPTVTPKEWIILVNAFAQLTPFQREVLRNRLHAIYFMDGLPGNALTFPDGGPTTEPKYSIAVRAGALHETVSELVTRKERTLFDSAGSELSVTVDGGTLNAMVYLLLHEGTHIVDFAVGAAPDPTHPSGNSPLVSGIWRDGVTPVDQYRLPILMGIPFRRNGRVIPIAHAADLYDALGRTPFISVYASCDSHDDLAELVAWTELTMRLHQPYRILISKGGIVMRCHRACPVKSGPGAPEVLEPANRIVIPIFCDRRSQGGEDGEERGLALRRRQGIRAGLRKQVRA